MNAQFVFRDQCDVCVLPIPSRLRCDSWRVIPNTSLYQGDPDKTIESHGRTILHDLDRTFKLSLVAPAVQALAGEITASGKKSSTQRPRRKAQARRDLQPGLCSHPPLRPPPQSLIFLPGTLVLCGLCIELLLFALSESQVSLLLTCLSRSNAVR